ncbi:MmpS family transport accessory protein [Chryseobacterium balustinum]|uniref:MmpS family transport accessory protein n=1 Tax=Chryseobacterium balustinum TaxID=246 RepID=UPI003CF79C47
MKLKNVLKGSFVMVMAALVFGFVTSCSNNDDDDNIPGTNKTHKVVFKAEASAGSNIDIAVYGIDGNPTTATSLSGTTWTSPEITTEAGAFNANVAVNAIGASTSSTLKVQIWVDGELKKEGTSSGQYLSASASHTF